MGSFNTIKFKDLRRIWNDDTTFNYRYNTSNTLLIDDSLEKSLLNPVNSLSLYIAIVEFICVNFFNHFQQVNNAIFPFTYNIAKGR